MTTGGSSFQYGEDFVSARLSIDVPTDGIANLRELTQEIDRFRVATEAAARSGENFEQGLRIAADAAERATTAQQNLISVMQRGVEMQERAASGSATAGGVNVPQGYVDPFSGAQAGTGRAPGSVPDAQSQIDALRERDPRSYVNMQAARCNLRPGEIPAEHPDAQQLHDTVNRVHRREQQNAQRQQENPAAQHVPRGMEGLGAGAGIAQQVMNEFGPGGSNMGMMVLAARGLGAAGKLGASAAAAGGLEGGALMNVLKGAGIAGAGLTAGLAGFGLVQQGGEIYQGFKNQGLVRGGGAVEGFQQEMSARFIGDEPVSDHRPEPSDHSVRAHRWLHRQDLRHRHELHEHKPS